MKFQKALPDKKVFPICGTASGEIINAVKSEASRRGITTSAMVRVILEHWHGTRLQENEVAEISIEG